jgi:hypothetical protein
VTGVDVFPPEEREHSTMEREVCPVEEEETWEV